MYIYKIPNFIFSVTNHCSCNFYQLTTNCDVKLYILCLLLFLGGMIYLLQIAELSSSLIDKSPRFNINAYMM